MVIVHGGGSDRFYGLWYLLAFLLDRGHRVMTANLPGHGVGGKDHFTLEAARHRLDEMISAAHSLGESSRIVLLGQSLGASLALDAVVRGAAVRAVVAISPIVQLRVRWSMLGELGALGADVARALEFDTLKRVIPPMGPFGRTRFPVRIAGGGSYVDAFAGAIRTLRLLRRLRRTANMPPLLIVHGEKDGIVPVSQAECLGRAVGATPFLVSGRHHLDLLWNGDVVRRIDRWIRTNASQSRPRAASLVSGGTGCNEDEQ